MERKRINAQFAGVSLSKGYHMVDVSGGGGVFGGSGWGWGWELHFEQESVK